MIIPQLQNLFSCDVELKHKLCNEEHVIEGDFETACNNKAKLEFQ
jgi:hypothetical protein